MKNKRKHWQYTKLAFEEYSLAKICVHCYTTEDICIHHKDWNTTNNVEKNLQILCISCHNKLHNKWKKHRDDTIKKMQKSWGWKNNGFYGKKHTEESKRRISKNHSRHMLWKTHTDEVKKRLSEMNKGKKQSKETIEKRSKALRNRGKKIDWMWRSEWMEKTGRSATLFYKLFKENGRK